MCRKEWPGGGCVLRGLCVFLELKKRRFLSHSAVVPFSVKGGQAGSKTSFISELLP